MPDTDLRSTGTGKADGTDEGSMGSILLELRGIFAIVQVRGL
ncbi:hypothetical protein AB9P05_07200 [Roseivirga sp. BDSF3-8]